MNRWILRSVAAIVVVWLTFASLTPVLADSGSGWQQVDPIQKALQQAQLALNKGDLTTTATLVTEAITQYQDKLAPTLSEASAEAGQDLEEALQQADAAASSGDLTAFAAASARARTALYRIGSDETLAALANGDPSSARGWLLIREFRKVSRVQRLTTDATNAVLQAQAGTMTAEAASDTVRTELYDTYQARLTEALHDLNQDETRDLPAARAQHAALAAGYFAILSPAYAEQRGAEALQTATATFTKLRETASTGQSVTEILPEIDTALQGFRAAPLTAAEQVRRAGQMLRFLSLVPVEYTRGVKGDLVTVDLEIQEAATFRDGSAAAFSDLRSILETRDPTVTKQIAEAFDTLEQQLNAAKMHTSVASADDIQQQTDAIAAQIKQIMPQEWQLKDSSADFDVIATALDQMETAIDSGEYALAESARLEAYAILESGPEAKLIVFAPQYKPIIEELFWNGQGDNKGLAYLIQKKAPASEINATRKALDVQLAAAEKALVGNNAPGAVVTNAAIIVFREGLEAVLILASLMGSFKMGEQRKLRKPLWWGAGAAFLASVLTWVLAGEALTALASYGERLEAVISIIAIVVLILITNWFFHDVYWTGWMASFHRQKKNIIGGSSQFVGLIVLGFSSIYREGFETVLFLQALVLEAGSAVVLSGVLIGLAGTALIGVIIFVVQAKLPYKKMLIVTGVMIGAVLLVMVGNTVNVLQVVGWLPIHPIRWLELPYWMGLWFGVYATWEGIGLQFAAGAFVIGSFFAAEWMHKRSVKTKQTTVKQTATAKPAAAVTKQATTTGTADMQGNVETAKQ